LGLGQGSGDGAAKAGFFGDIKVHGVPVWLKTDVECEFKIEFKSGPLPVFAANVAVRRNAVKVVGFSD